MPTVFIVIIEYLVNCDVELYAVVQFFFFSSSGLLKLWSALTLIGSYQDELCAVRVTQVN